MRRIERMVPLRQQDVADARVARGHGGVARPRFGGIAGCLNEGDGQVSLLRPLDDGETLAIHLHIIEDACVERHVLMRACVGHGRAAVGAHLGFVGVGEQVDVGDSVPTDDAVQRVRVIEGVDQAASAAFAEAEQVQSARAWLRVSAER
ncbi:MAG: hypothetical protein K0R75_944, partial [Paenibacillaceae bacterium]|nr:hypothetical protein [Paenibacillaceae bacterium]